MSLNNLHKRWDLMSGKKGSVSMKAFGACLK